MSACKGSAYNLIVQPQFLAGTPLGHTSLVTSALSSTRAQIHLGRSSKGLVTTQAYDHAIKQKARPEMSYLARVSAGTLLCTDVLMAQKGAQNLSLNPIHLEVCTAVQAREHASGRGA